MEERCFETEYILTTDNDSDEHDDDDGDGIFMNVRIMMMKVVSVMAESYFETEYKPPTLYSLIIIVGPTMMMSEYIQRQQ